VVLSEEYFQVYHNAEWSQHIRSTGTTCGNQATDYISNPNNFKIFKLTTNLNSETEAITLHCKQQE
jgi:hypothetical protein